MEARAVMDRRIQRRAPHCDHRAEERKRQTQRIWGRSKRNQRIWSGGAPWWRRTGGMGWPPRPEWPMAREGVLSLPQLSLVPQCPKGKSCIFCFHPCTRISYYTSTLIY